MSNFDSNVFNKNDPQPFLTDRLDDNFIRRINSINREIGESDRQPCHEYLLVNRLMRTGKFKMNELELKSYNELLLIEKQIKNGL